MSTKTILSISVDLGNGQLLRAFSQRNWDMLDTTDRKLVMKVVAETLAAMRDAITENPDAIAPNTSHKRQHRTQRRAIAPATTRAHHPSADGS